MFINLTFWDTVLKISRDINFHIYLTRSFLPISYQDKKLYYLILNVCSSVLPTYS